MPAQILFKQLKLTYLHQTSNSLPQLKLKVNDMTQQLTLKSPFCHSTNEHSN